MKGKLYGIGVGPGDSELMAKRTLSLHLKQKRKMVL